MEFDGIKIRAEGETYPSSLKLDKGIELIAETMGYTKSQLKIDYSEVIPYIKGYILKVQGILYFSNNQEIDGRIIGVLKEDKEYYSIEMLSGKLIPFDSLKSIIQIINNKE